MGLTRVRLRGGYFELQNVPADVRSQLTKMASISLCSNVVGQFAAGLMVKPPVKGEPSHESCARRPLRIRRLGEVCGAAG